MKYFLLIISFLLIVGIFGRSLLTQHTIAAPVDDLVGLYHPYIDLFTPNFPRGVPFKNSLITDPIRQQIPWKSLVVESLKSHQLPLWNPYNGIGTPLLANFQSGVFYIFNALFLFFPFITAWNVYIFSQPILGFFFMFLFLRRIKVSIIGSFIGGLIFAFCGFNIAWMEWGNVGHTLLWLPLILFTKEKLLEKWQLKYAVLLIFAELSAIFAGGLQVWFYTLLVSNAYLFIRVYQVMKIENQRVTIRSYARQYLPFFIVGFIIFAISLIQFIPTFQFILSSARDVDQSWHVAGWFLPWQNLVQFIAPDYFGNPATLNYWGVWNYGEFIGYIGIGGLLLSLCGIVFGIVKRSFYALFFSAVTFLSLIFILPSFMAQLPFILHIPFLSSSQPTRLMAVVDLSLAILAGIGWDSILVLSRKQKVFVLTLFAVLCTATVGSILLLHTDPINIQIAKRNIVSSTVFFVFSFIGFILMQHKNKFIRTLGVTGFIFVLTFDLLRFGTKFESFSLQNYFYPPTKILSFLERHTQDSRVMTLDDRVLPPNINAYYHIPVINNYDPLYSLRYAQFIAMMERNKPDISSPFGFNRIISPKNYTSPFIERMGVKYILSFGPVSDPSIHFVMSEGDTYLYEISRVTTDLPYAASSVTHAKDPQEAAIVMYVHRNDDLGQVVVEGLQSNQYMPPEQLHLISETANEKVLTFNSDHNAFVVFSDQYYPSWRAYIDNTETKVYPTDITFFGISVPAGKHIITVKDSLF